jgi:hypothetical protein
MVLDRKVWHCGLLRSPVSFKTKKKQALKKD